MQYTEEQIEQLNNDLNDIEEEFRKRFFHVSNIVFKEKRANEFFKHGFFRRFNMLFHCIERVFEIYPPNRTKVLEDEERFDLEAFIQAFTINLYGAIDNLAWIVNAENKLGLEIKAITKITLYNPIIQQYFSEDFIEYLNDENENGFKKWYNLHCKNFRHAIGHRIPLYIPPCGITNEEKYNEIQSEKWAAILEQNFKKVDELEDELNSLEHILPIYTHSFEEKSFKMYIHPQLIADFRTLLELSDRFFKAYNQTIS